MSSTLNTSADRAHAPVRLRLKSFVRDRGVRGFGESSMLGAKISTRIAFGHGGGPTLAARVRSSALARVPHVGLFGESDDVV